MIGPLQAGAPRLRAAVLLAVAVALVSGCGGSAPAPQGTVGVPVPAPSASGGDDIGPADEALPESRPVRGASFTLFAPAEFQQSEREGPDGVPMLVLSKEAGQPGGVVEIVAFDENDPSASAAEQLWGLEGELTGIQGATDVSRRAVAWPGADEGIVLQWTRPAASSGGDLVERWTQLSVQVGSRRITTVIAVAPENEFETSEVLDVLRTLELDTA